MLLDLIGEENFHFLPKRSSLLLAFFLEVQNLSCKPHWLKRDDFCKGRMYPLMCKTDMVNDQPWEPLLAWVGGQEWGMGGGGNELALP